MTDLGKTLTAELSLLLEVLVVRILWQVGKRLQTLLQHPAHTATM